MSRRDFAAALAAAVANTGPARAIDPPSDPSDSPRPRPVHIAMLLFPGMTTLDLVGPQALLAGVAGESFYLVAKTPGPVATDTSLSLLAATPFDACPRDLDVLFVPVATARRSRCATRSPLPSWPIAVPALHG